MQPFFTKKPYLYAYFITVTVTVLAALFFSTIFTLIPLHTKILTVFANLSLGLAVFIAGFYIARRTPFFRFAHVVYLSFFVTLTMIFFSFLWGEPNPGFLGQKILLISASSLLGEISGRL